MPDKQRGPADRLSRCPYCARPYNRHRTIEGQGAPEPGDVSICIGCGEVCIFNESLRLRRPTQAERRDALADRNVTQLRRRVMIGQYDRN
jgi:hypothetical protein